MRLISKAGSLDNFLLSDNLNVTKVDESVNGMRWRQEIERVLREREGAGEPPLGRARTAALAAASEAAAAAAGEAALAAAGEAAAAATSTAAPQ